MRSFGSLARKQIAARKVRSALTGAGIVLGVAMILAVLTLSATVQGTFSDLFDSVYGRTDLIVSGDQQTSVKPRVRRQVESTRGVEEVAERVTGIFVLVDDDGLASERAGSRLNVAGEEAAAADLTDSTTVDGRRVRSGREIAVQDSWARSNGVEVGDRIAFATPSGVSKLEVVGLFQFSTGLEFGGEGFAVMPLAPARRLLDRPRGIDEIALVVADGEQVEAVQRRLTRRLPRGVLVDTPQGRSDEIEDQLQGFDTIVFFFAAMALFVGGFLIYNAFNMTVLQRTREIGMLRTIGASQSAIVRSVLREALYLGIAGAIAGCGLGVVLAYGLVELLRNADFPIGSIEWGAPAAVAAVATGLATAFFGALIPARRASRVPPIRAVLGAEGLRQRPRRRRAVIGIALIVAGAAGAYWLGAADEVTSPVIAAGMGGTIGVFLGIALVAPFLIGPLVRVLSWPARILLPAEGRLAADAARSDAVRTAATATGLLIGLALVVAIQTLGSSFLQTIEDELDRTFARDLTVQPRGFSPGEGPQQTIARKVGERLREIPEAGVVASQRLLFTSELPGPDGKTGSQGLLFAFDPDTFAEVDQTKIVGATREQAFDGLRRGGVTVGKGHAEEFDLEVGDRIVLEGPSATRRARVSGLVETVFAGGQTVGMSLRTMRQVYGVTADSQLALKARSPGERDVLRRKVDEVLEKRFPNLEALSNEEVKADAEDQFEEVLGFFVSIVGVAVIASLFGIINTLSMSVYERTREIGLLRALGATRWQVRRSVAVESLVIGLIGALLGIVVGAAIGWALLQGLAAGVPGIVYEAPRATMAAVAFAGVVLGLLASVIPARRAARQEVIEALSYE